jgi:hypothetical protein
MTLRERYAVAVSAMAIVLLASLVTLPQPTVAESHTPVAPMTSAAAPSLRWGAQIA